MDINTLKIKKMGEDLREDIRNRFDIKNISKQYQDLYFELLK